jgi:hypothetical protein
MDEHGFGRSRKNDNPWLPDAIDDRPPFPDGDPRWETIQGKVYLEHHPERRKVKYQEPEETGNLLKAHLEAERLAEETPEIFGSLMLDHVLKRKRKREAKRRRHEEEGTTNTQDDQRVLADD